MVSSPCARSPPAQRLPFIPHIYCILQLCLVTGNLAGNLSQILYIISKYKLHHKAPNISICHLSNEKEEVVDLLQNTGNSIKSFVVFCSQSVVTSMRITTLLPAWGFDGPGFKVTFPRQNRFSHSFGFPLHLQKVLCLTTVPTCHLSVLVQDTEQRCERSVLWSGGNKTPHLPLRSINGFFSSSLSFHFSETSDRSCKTLMWWYWPS